MLEQLDVKRTERALHPYRMGHADLPASPRTKAILSGFRALVKVLQTLLRLTSKGWIIHKFV